MLAILPVGVEVDFGGSMDILKFIKAPQLSLNKLLLV